MTEVVSALPTAPPAGPGRAHPASGEQPLALGPATRLLWRTPGTVHLELGSRAVVVEGVSPEFVRRVVTPPGEAAPPPSDTAPGRQVAAALAEAGYLWPRVPAGDIRRTPPEARLAGELAALAAQHGEAAAEVLWARRYLAVTVEGTSRVATHVAALLAAAGIGRVHCVVDGDAKLRHAVPGGVEPADEGQPLAAAAVAAIRRAAPEADTTAPSVGERPDLVVLAHDVPVDDDRLDALHAAGAAHLPVGLGTDHGIVGPLVLPGLTSCLRCADLHRRDRDPAWGALAVQLSLRQRYGPVSDAAVATVTAGIAALQALAFLDGGDPACIDGTLELRLPDWRVRRRSWTLHPDCGCADPAPA